MDIAAFKIWVVELGIKIGQLEMEIKGLKEENELLKMENNSLKTDISELKISESQSEASTVQLDSDDSDNDNAGFGGVRKNKMATKLIQTYRTLKNGKRQRIHFDDKLDPNRNEPKLMPEIPADDEYTNEERIRENETKFVGIGVQVQSSAVRKSAVLQELTVAGIKTEEGKVESPRKCSNDVESFFHLVESVKKTENGNVNPLFHGMQFFLTFAQSDPKDPSTSGSSTSPVKYDKDECQEAIENNGGNVVNLVGHENNKRKSQIFLISNSHARTKKYIYCLAAGIPCVSWLWIEECLKQSSIVDWKPFELNSGYSYEQDFVIPAHQKKPKPLKGIRVYVTAKSEELYNLWNDILIAAQANLLKPMRSCKRPRIPTVTEVLVTDETCPLKILNMARDKNIPVVKPEWLIQTIITGQKAKIGGRTYYKVYKGMNRRREKRITKREFTCC